MHVSAIWLLGASLVIIPVVNSDRNANEYCYADDKYPYVYFSTKTSYDLLPVAKNQNIPHCKPAMMWGNIRHGTRYANVETIEKMRNELPVLRDAILENHQEKRGKLCERDLLQLGRWSLSVQVNMADTLTELGKSGIAQLAERLKRQFPGIVDNYYTPGKYSLITRLHLGVFQSDGMNRTEESARIFFDRWFPYENFPGGNSSLITYSKSCMHWMNHFKKDTNQMEEYTKFKHSDRMNGVLDGISRRLGFTHNLSFDSVKLMYDSCRFEKAWDIASQPPFCAAFLQDQLKVLEYLEDLKYYYLYGYGNDMMKNLACPLLTDMMTRFAEMARQNRTARSGSDGKDPVGVFYFSHTAVHLPLLTLLGMKYNAEYAPTAANYDDGYTPRREWQTSFISPFTANIVAVFYKCMQKDENQVLFYLNEKPVSYGHCDTSLCPWKVLEDILQPVIDSGLCNFKFCSKNDASSQSAAAVFTLFVTWLAYKCGAIFFN